MQYLLDQDTLAFIQSSEVSLYLAGSDARRQPHATRAFGCRPAANGGLLSWISRSGTDTLLASIESNGRLALAISHVQSYRTIQLKALDARVVAVDRADYAYILDHQRGFIAKLVSMGYPEDVMRTHVQFRVDNLAAIQFTPSAAFMQTPGPKAGAAMAMGKP